MLWRLKSIDAQPVPAANLFDSTSFSKTRFTPESSHDDHDPTYYI